MEKWKKFFFLHFRKWFSLSTQANVYCTIVIWLQLDFVCFFVLLCFVEMNSVWNEFSLWGEIIVNALSFYFVAPLPQLHRVRKLYDFSCFLLFFFYFILKSVQCNITKGRADVWYKLHFFFSRWIHLNKQINLDKTTSTAREKKAMTTPGQ